MKAIGNKFKNLKRYHRQLALGTFTNLRFQFPSMEVELYETIKGFYYFAPEHLDSSKELDEYLKKHKPIGVPLYIATELPSEAIKITEKLTYSQELWLSGQPLSVIQLNKVLRLASKKLPSVNLDYSREIGCWVISSHSPLTKIQKDEVEKAFQTIGFDESLDYKITNLVRPHKNAQRLSKIRREPFELAVSGYNNGLSSLVTKSLEKDEEIWRNFLMSRSQQNVPIPNAPHKLSCLFDASDKSNVRLSELLTMYEVVNLIPEREGGNWLQRHQVSLPNIQELVEKGRLRLILPESVTAYDQHLINAVGEVSTDALTLSRELATKSIARNQTKDPILYGAYSGQQRLSILKILAHVSRNNKLAQALLSSYGELFASQEIALMERGAYAFLGQGVGRHMASIMTSIHGKKVPDLELMMAGASVEWALGLGANYIPRNHGESFDESNHSLLVASFLGNSKYTPVDPIANRMHIAIDGLLAVTNIPPVEVARTFSSTAVKRFHTVAKKLMSGNISTEELNLAVKSINADVTHFEKRKDRITSWQLHTLAGIMIGGATSQALDSYAGFSASWITQWVFSLLKSRVPSSFQEEIATIADIMLSLAVGSNIDSVIVSRSQKALG